VLERLAAAVDFWIVFSARLSRRPGPWIALHRLLSVPLLLRVDWQRLELEHDGERIRVRCRARFAAPVAAVLSTGSPAGRGARGAVDGDHDLEVIQVHPWAARWWCRRGWLTVPAFVRYQGPLDSIPPRRVSKSLRGNLARARRNGFRPRRGEGADWDRARAMAERWGHARFGPDVWKPPEHAWRRLRRRGHLILIGDGSRDVAMAVIVPAGGGRDAWFASIGIAGGDGSLLRAGALTGAYAAAVEEARRIGAAILDTGRCSPRADDSIAAYKQRWGLGPTPDPLSPLFALRARTPAGERLLTSLPLWALDSRGALRRVGPGGDSRERSGSAWLR
jgi:hypothetical protein